MAQITDIKAEEILDSRGKPTVKATAWAGKDAGSFSVPSGASTGSKEATELRDADGHVSQAIKNIHEIIAPKLVGMDAHDQMAIDAAMKELDGTPFKSHLGGNAMLAVSGAAAKAAAASDGIELWQYLRTIAQMEPSRRSPYLYMNYINGGKHAQSPLSFQEHMIVPKTDSVADALTMAEAVSAALAVLIGERYGDAAAQSMGDEGGYVIPERDPFAPFRLLAEALEIADCTGKAYLATDVAASSFFKDDLYEVGGELWDAARLSDFYHSLAAQFPIISIEDPFEEHALLDFAALQSGFAPRIVGDDLTVTDATRITEAARAGAIRAVIIKPNQIGTLTEVFDAMRAARAAGIDCIVSHRSGETGDTFIADLAFATGAFGLKSGALRKSERRVKYERLRMITAEHA